MATGVKALRKWLEDKKPLSPRKAIVAFCADCMGEYSGGPQDCGSKICPLYPYHPYNPNKLKGSRKGRKDFKPGESNVETIL